MKRKTINLVVALMICLSVSATESMASELNFISSNTLNIPEAPGLTLTVYLDNEEIPFAESDGTPFLDANGRTQVPLRRAMEAAGVAVSFDNATRTVSLSKDGINISLTINSPLIHVGERVFQLDTAPVIIQSRTYVPIRFVFEQFGYAVNWDSVSRAVSVIELTPFHINGGTTGIFQRKQLPFSGFDGVRADVALPYVVELDEGDCPYVYFGFDWAYDIGNVEGGFQFIEDPTHQHYNKWTVFLRQGNEWRWGNNIFIEQGETRHLSFYAEYIAENHVDLVIELDGQEVIRKKSAVENFGSASVKTVISMATTKIFDGHNCFSKSIGAKLANVEVRTFGLADFEDFGVFPLYSSWRPEVGANGMWFGTSICVPSYIHLDVDGKVSIYNREKFYENEILYNENHRDNCRRNVSTDTGSSF